MVKYITRTFTTTLATGRMITVDPLSGVVNTDDFNVVLEGEYDLETAKKPAFEALNLAHDALLVIDSVNHSTQTLRMSFENFIEAAEPVPERKPRAKKDQ